MLPVRREREGFIPGPTPGAQSNVKRSLPLLLICPCSSLPHHFESPVFPPSRSQQLFASFVAPSPLFSSPSFSPRPRWNSGHTKLPKVSFKTTFLSSWTCWTQFSIIRKDGLSLFSELFLKFEHDSIIIIIKTIIRVMRLVYITYLSSMVSIISVT